jgi:hypothetical protein
VGGDPRDVHAATVVLDYEENVEAAQERVGFQNPATGPDQRFKRGFVMIDQAAEDRSMPDVAVDRLRDVRLRAWQT